MPRLPLRPLAGLLLLLLAGSAAFTLREVAVSGRVGLPLDDGWIHAALARNLAVGASFAPNPDDPIVPCSTAPLWTVLEAAVLRGTLLLEAKGDPDGIAAIVAAKALGIVCGLGACALLARLVRRVTGSASLGFLAGAMLATQPRFIWGVLSGLEVPLYAGLVLLGLDLHVAHRDAPDRRRHLATVVFGLSGYARPENFLFLPLLLLDRLFFGAPHGRRPGAFARDAIVAVAVAATFPALNLLLWGHPLPTTFYVKAQAGSVLAAFESGGLAAGARYLGTAIVHQGIWTASFFPALFVALTPLAGRGAVACVRKPGRPASILPLAFLGFGLLHAFLGPTNPVLQSARRFLMLPPMLIALAIAGTADLTLARASRVAAAATGAVLLSLGVVALAGVDAGYLAGLARYFGLGEAVLAGETFRGLPLGALASLALRFATGLALVHAGLAGIGLGGLATPGRRTIALLAGLVFAQNAAGILDHGEAYARNSRDTHELNVRPAVWMRDHLPTTAEVAVHDLGAAAYFSHRRIVDLEGIGTPAAIEARRGGPAALVRFLREERPTHYAGSEGGLRPDYAAAFKELVLAGELDRQPLFQASVPENATVANGAVFVARFTW